MAAMVRDVRSLCVRRNERKVGYVGLGQVGGCRPGRENNRYIDEPKGPRGVWLSSKHGGRRQKIRPEK